MNFSVLRSKPSESSAQLGVARLYTPFHVVKHRAKWAHVQDDRYMKFWIENEHLTDQFQCVSVTSSVANLRKGPGTNFKKIGQQFENYTGKVLDSKGDWINVKGQNGKIFWIHERLVWKD